MGFRNILRKRPNVSPGLMGVIDTVNAVYAREGTCRVTHPQTREYRDIPIAEVWDWGTQMHDPRYACSETAFGYDITLARLVNPLTQKPLATYDGVKKMAEALRIRLGVPRVEFFDKNDGGPLHLWIPKSEPDTVYWATMIDGVSLGINPMEMVVGLDRHEQPVVVDMANGPSVHIGYFGSTGSGKSTAADMALLTMILHTPPDLMRLIILDCDSRAHEQWQKMPHCLLYAGGGEHNRREILTALKTTYELMNRRKAANISTDNGRIPSHREPYIVVLIDDAQELEKWDRSILPVLDSMLGTSRKSGFRVILTSSSDPTKTYFGESIRNNIGRIVASADSSKSASLSGRGKSGAHDVDRERHEFILAHNNKTKLIYQPFLLAGTQPHDVNNDGRDDVQEVIALFERRQVYSRPINWHGTAPLALPQPQAQPTETPVAASTGSNIIAFPAGETGQRVMKGVTFDEAVRTASEAARQAAFEGKRFRQADAITAVFGSSVFGGNHQTQFVREMFAEALSVYQDNLPPERKEAAS